MLKLKPSPKSGKSSLGPRILLGLGKVGFASEGFFLGLGIFVFASERFI